MGGGAPAAQTILLGLHTRPMVFVSAEVQRFTGRSSKLLSHVSKLLGFVWVPPAAVAIGECQTALGSSGSGLYTLLNKRSGANCAEHFR